MPVRPRVLCAERKAAAVRLLGGDVGVVLRRLCEVVGSTPTASSSASPGWRRPACAGQTTVTMTVVADDAKPREMAILPRRSTPMGAATLNASRCAPSVSAEAGGVQG
jgi:hypothetical protein